MPAKKEAAFIEKAFSAFDGPASFYYILQKASNVTGFLAWLTEFHKILPNKEILAGYKLLLGSIFKGFLEEINTKTTLGLATDEILERADFKGITLADIPNTCEKTIVIKRIWSHERKIFGATSWDEIEQASRVMNEELNVFEQLFKEHCKTTAPFDKEYVIQAIACDHILTHLNDTSRGFPLAETCFPPDKHTATELYLKNAFPGYVYGLQYLWYSILGETEYNGTCVKDLHLVLSEEENQTAEKGSFFEAFSGQFEFNNVEPIDENDLDDDMKHVVDFIKRDRPPRSERWEHLDRFYRLIQKEIVDPREDKLKVALGISHLLVLEGYNKSLLKDLLEPGKVSQPGYLKKNDTSSVKKQLELAMLWYDANVLDTQLSVFNGVPAFAPTLVGSVELAKAFRGAEQVKAIVFKHPADCKNKFDYSFGLLVRAVTSLGISDYSGWLIFFDCATDHSGFGGSLLDYAKDAIATAKKIGPVEVQEIISEKNLFKEYLEEHSVSSVFDVLIKETPVGARRMGSLTTIQTEMNDFLGKAKGKLLEYTVEKWVRQATRVVKAKCDIKINGEQIDCLAESDSLVSFYECKMNIHRDTVDATVNQINRKLKVLLKDQHNIRIEPWLVVFEKISSDAKKEFEKNGIFVQDDFRRIIKDNRCFVGARAEILSILDWQFSTSHKLT